MNIENEEGRQLILEMAIKCADLCNAAKPLDISKPWVDKIMEEFYRQGDREKELGLPVSKFMDRDSPNVAKCQVGFIDILVHPIYEAWSNFNMYEERFSRLTRELQRNRGYWSGQAISKDSLSPQLKKGGPSTGSLHNPQFVKKNDESDRNSMIQIFRRLSAQKISFQDLIKSQGQPDRVPSRNSSIQSTNAQSVHSNFPQTSSSRRGSIKIPKISSIAGD